MADKWFIVKDNSTKDGNDIRQFVGIGDGTIMKNKIVNGGRKRTHMFRSLETGYGLWMMESKG